jgi:hypothetical protein
MFQVVRHGSAVEACRGRNEAVQRATAALLQTASTPRALRVAFGPLDVAKQA